MKKNEWGFTFIIVGVLGGLFVKEWSLAIPVIFLGILNFFVHDKIMYIINAITAAVVGILIIVNGDPEKWYRYLWIVALFGICIFELWEFIDSYKKNKED
jgi:hypothetical protein